VPEKSKLGCVLEPGTYHCIAKFGQDQQRFTNRALIGSEDSAGNQIGSLEIRR
jgi:hypothetical protein